jgi:hypothetical protein
MTCMRRNTIAIVVVLGWACTAGDATAQGSAALPLAASAVGPRSVGEDSHETIGNAIAGALVSALSEQLGGRAVDMKLDAIEVKPVSVSERAINGTGSLRIQGDDDWVGFRVQVMYDSQLGSTGYPQVGIGGVAAGERDIPNDGLLVQKLDTEVVDALSREFRQPSVRLQLDRISTVQAGSRYLRINADGLADFGRDGSADAKIEALYDRSSGQWLRVHYEVGGGPERTSQDVPLVKR